MFILKHVTNRLNHNGLYKLTIKTINWSLTELKKRNIKAKKILSNKLIKKTRGYAGNTSI